MTIAEEVESRMKDKQYLVITNEKMFTASYQDLVNLETSNTKYRILDSRDIPQCPVCYEHTMFFVDWHTKREKCCTCGYQSNTKTGTIIE